MSNDPIATLGEICSTIERHLAELEIVYQSLEGLMAIIEDIRSDIGIY